MQAPPVDELAARVGAAFDDRTKLVEEYQDVLKQIEYLKSVLASEALVRSIIKDELTQIREAYRDDRRTQIVKEEGEINIEDLIAEEEVVVGEAEPRERDRPGDGQGGDEEEAALLGAEGADQLPPAALTALLTALDDVALDGMQPAAAVSLSLVAGVVAPAWAGEDGQSHERLIAVLPLDVRDAGTHMSAADRRTLEETLRNHAVNALAPCGWRVMTGETTQQILASLKVDPAKCASTSCQMETAQNLTAEKFVSGTVHFSDGEYVASIRATNTEDGRVLAAETLTAKSVKDLRKQVDKVGREFFQRSGLCGGSTPAPVVSMRCARCRTAGALRQWAAPKWSRGCCRCSSSRSARVPLLSACDSLPSSNASDV